MECVLLGSGGMMPMPYRFLTSLAVRHQGHTYLFDAGEGAQIAIKTARLGVKPIRVISVSHLHGDHCLGLPGLIMMRAQVPDPVPLTILGPTGIKRFVDRVRDSLGYHMGFPLTFVEWEEGVPDTAYEDDEIRILWEPLSHTVPCLGYRLEEHERPGKFRPAAAQACGVPAGPLWAELQRGREVELEDGRRIRSAQVLGPPRPGRRIAYATDTRPCKPLYRVLKDVDMAFLDGMFLPEHCEEAERRGHMTVDDGARVASRAGALRAVLVHLSPRYGQDRMEELATAARGTFEGAEIGRDFAVYRVPSRG